MSEQPINAPTDEYDFDDLSPQEIPVRVAGKRYVLREGTGGDVIKYRNMIIKATRLGADGKPAGMDGFADCEPYLLARCLFEQAEGPDGKVTERKVSEQLVNSWPNRVQKKLFQKLSDMTGLDEDETEEALLLRKKTIEDQLTRVRAKKGEVLEKNEHDG